MRKIPLAWWLSFATVAFLVFLLHPYWVVYWPAAVFARHEYVLLGALFLGLCALGVRGFRSAYGTAIWRKPREILPLLLAMALFSWGTLVALNGISASLALLHSSASLPRCALVLEHAPGPDSLFSRVHAIELRYAALDGQTDDVNIWYTRDNATIGNVSPGNYVAVSGRGSPFGFIVESIQPTSQCHTEG